MAKQCNTLFSRKDFNDDTGCLKPNGHFDSHLCKTVEGRYFEWEYDLNCGCQDCMTDDVNDACIIYTEVNPKLALAKLKGLRTLEIVLSEKEVNIISDLLNVASGDWYNKDILPEGIKTVKEADTITRLLAGKVKLT